MQNEIKKFKSELKRIMKIYGWELTDTQLEKFFIYRDELKRWNQKINLTAIEEDKEIIEKHFLDSISILHYIDIPVHAKIADVGSGAGFPGLPIKILRPEINLFLIEQNSKKASFLNFIIATLELNGVKVANMKVEEFIENYPDTKFDIVLTRFLASLKDSVEYCVKLLKNKGVFIAYKGFNVRDEIKLAEKKLNHLEAEIVGLIELDIPELERVFVFIEKNEPCSYAV